MTTMTEKLLAKAEQYEQKAQALRFAAAEMNGDAVETKRKTVVGTLDAAIALRRAQSNGSGQNGHHAAPGRQGSPQTRATMPERQTTVRAFLEAASGPQTTRAIQDRLEGVGQGCSTSWVLKVLNAMKDVHKHGKGNQSTWGLGKAQRAKPGSRLPEKLAARALTAKVLDAYDRETPRQPGEVAKSLGLTVPKSGFAPLVHQGYLKKKRDGYVRTKKTYVVEDAPAASVAAE